MSTRWAHDEVTPLYFDGRVYMVDARPIHHPVVTITAQRPRRRFATATDYADRAFQGCLAGWLFILTVWGITSIG